MLCVPGVIISKSLKSLLSINAWSKNMVMTLLVMHYFSGLELTYIAISVNFCNEECAYWRRFSTVTSARSSIIPITSLSFLASVYICLCSLTSSGVARYCAVIRLLSLAADHVRTAPHTPPLAIICTCWAGTTRSLYICPVLAYHQMVNLAACLPTMSCEHTSLFELCLFTEAWLPHRS